MGRAEPPGSQSRDRRVIEDVADRRRATESLPGPCDQSHRRQRHAADGKEIVVTPWQPAPKDLSPEFSDRQLMALQRHLFDRIVSHTHDWHVAGESLELSSIDLAVEREW